MDLIGNIWLTDTMVNAVAAETGVHRTTVARWIERGELPYAIERLLDIIHNGNLGEIHDDWHGWSICRKTVELVSPTDLTIKPGEVQSIPYRHRQLATLQRERCVGEEAASGGSGLS